MTGLDGQLGFEAMLLSADRANESLQQDKLYGHLPGTMDEALPYFRALIDRHHAAMLEGNGELVEALREEAHDLATKLNGYESGIIADEDAPGCVLERLTAAPSGAIPLWGQIGSFEITHGGMRVSVEMDGIFGVSATGMSWMGFAVHAVEWDRPFLSETGYRSFLGVGGPLVPGYTPDKFVAEVVAANIRQDFKGKVPLIQPQYRPGACRETR